MTISGFAMKTEFTRKILKGLGIIAGLFLIGYALLILFFIVAQGFYIFEPGKKYRSPKDIVMNEDFQEVTLRTSDNLVLDAWLHEGDVQKPAILYLHGNNRELAYFAPRLVPYIKAQYTVLMLEYRGYGRNAGRPSEEGLITDALAGYKYLKQKGYKVVVVHGFSLGTGVAMGLADLAPVDGVILEAPFYSLLSLAQEKFPYLPVSLILRDPFLSNQRMHRLEEPLLILHGTNDETIPYHHSKRLFAETKKPHKTAVFIEGGTHLNLLEKKMFDAIFPWLEKNFQKK